ncbi:hypothetical protein ACF08N_02510 [Streptomyces sp. NPDC015127]|uniref:hypothetical protein n=1 Tax=Streptomyces sp. NPDC015127 TaxID=3364939 RepID=UPI0036F914D7
MTRRIESTTALLRRGDLSVTEVCFAVGCASLGTFTTRSAELVGMPPGPSGARRRLWRPAMLMLWVQPTMWALRSRWRGYRRVWRSK